MDDLYITPDSTDVQRAWDDAGRLVHLEHSGAGRFVANDPSPLELAARYVRSNIALYARGLELALTEPLRQEYRPDQGPELHFVEQQTVHGTTVVTYAQTLRGLPLWQAGLAVVISPYDAARRRASSSTSTLYSLDVARDVDAARPEGAPYAPAPLGEGITLTKLAASLGLTNNPPPFQLIRINGQQRLLYYHYIPEDRQEWALYDGKDEAPPDLLAARPPAPPLPKVPDSIRPGMVYLVTEVFFTLKMPIKDKERATSVARVQPQVAPDAPYADGTGTEVHWRAFLEVRNGTVLYLRAALAFCFDTLFPADPAAEDISDFVSATGHVFIMDPLTQRGNDPFDPFAPGYNPTDSALAQLLAPVDLEHVRLTAPPQALNGQWVALSDLYVPFRDLPTEPAPPFDFTFGVQSAVHKFTGVNAYYHCDAMFRMLRSLKLLDVFFPQIPQTPIQVDPEGMGGSVGGLTLGDALFTRVDRIFFGNAREDAFQIPQAIDIGSAIDLRVVLHEFSHVLLWAKVHSPNLGFVHSVGDSLAVILNDPCSRLTGDARYETFPWHRRENPNVSDDNWRYHGGNRRACTDQGWCWRGDIYKRDRSPYTTYPGYKREQILATTLFRVYQVIGGHPDNTLPGVRNRAALYMAYIIMRAIAASPHDDYVPTRTPEEFVTALMSADKDTATVENPTGDAIPGGSVHKVIRWSFELQGLYQQPPQPQEVNGPGRPTVDLYIGAIRDHYSETPTDLLETVDIWNRTGPDTGTTHQEPVPGATNYAWVRVRNRGYDPATEVLVRGYHRPWAADLVWSPPPAPGWTAMSAPAAQLPTTVAAPATATAPHPGVLFGPFAWNPGVAQSWCLLMAVSAKEDPSNIDPDQTHACAVGPTRLDRLIPFDNNVAARRVGLQL